MSDSDHRRPWHLYVQDMIEFGERVCNYTDGHDQATFVSDSLIYDATIRNLELIGEAATHVPQSVRDTSPDVPWRAIVGLRNRLIHSYGGIDNDIIWTLIQDAVPKLLPTLRDLLRVTSEDSS